MLLFLRSAVLTIGNVAFEGRVTFNIEKMQGGAAPCEIKAHNMTQAHRNSFEDRPANALTIYLSCGYGGVNKLLYAGTVLYTESLRQGPDIVTSFHCSAAVPAMHRAVLSLSGQLTDLDVYQRCLTALAPFGISKGMFSPTVESLLGGGTYARGYAEIGYTSKFLDDICKRGGLAWGIDGDNELNIHSPKEFGDSEEIVLSATSGMIGFPTKTQIAGCYKVRALLDAELRPGKKIRVISQQLKLPGDIRIIKATHVGDTLEGDWYTDVEAMDLHAQINLSGTPDGGING